ncbi:MAG: hypothetical protein ABMA14_19240 [Hyphomonadaceae bacterium]
MVARWLSNLKWFLLIAIVAGPGWTYYNWTLLETIKRVGAEGVETTGLVDGGESHSGRRSGTSYKIHVIWQDTANTQHAENVDISSEYANKIIQGDMLTIDTVQIKYLASDAKAPVFVVEDLPQQQDDKQIMIWVGLAAGIAGIIGSAIFFLTGRNKKA